MARLVGHPRPDGTLVDGAGAAIGTYAVLRSWRDAGGAMHALVAVVDGVRYHGRASYLAAGVLLFPYATKRGGKR